MCREFALAPTMDQRATASETCLSVSVRGKYNRKTVCEESSVKRFSDTGSIPAGSTKQKKTRRRVFLFGGAGGSAEPVCVRFWHLSSLQTLGAHNSLSFCSQSMTNCQQAEYVNDAACGSTSRLKIDTRRRVFFCLVEPAVRQNPSVCAFGIYLLCKRKSPSN